MNNDQNKLLRFIYEVGFAIDDVVLYLDTHPCDKQALEYYENYKKIE
ncbi:spore coat protein CotJB [Clostridium sp.]|nr:spore coat protein CotJB [Clostridium sp.]MEE0568070.1 spore coat protein CotJB [Clostridium sp.]